MSEFIPKYDRVSKPFKTSEWLTEGPEDAAKLKAAQALEAENLKDAHEREVEALKLKHERENERQAKKDEAEKERESRTESVESMTQYDTLDEGKLVATMAVVFKKITDDILELMQRNFNKNEESGIVFANKVAQIVNMKVSNKKQAKGQLFLKLGEELDKDASKQDYIDDFLKSDAPQFKGKTKEKIVQMAVAAWLDSKEDK